MTTLTIRNVDAAVKERLRVRVAQHGRSMEAELRAIVNEAVKIGMLTLYSMTVLNASASRYL